MICTAILSSIKNRLVSKEKNCDCNTKKDTKRKHKSLRRQNKRLEMSYRREFDEHTGQSRLWRMKEWLFTCFHSLCMSLLINKKIIYNQRYFCHTISGKEGKNSCCISLFSTSFRERSLVVVFVIRLSIEGNMRWQRRWKIAEESFEVIDAVSLVNCIGNSVTWCVRQSLMIFYLIFDIR